MPVLFNKCYICDLSAMDDGNVELDLGLVLLGEDNSAECWKASWFNGFHAKDAIIWHWGQLGEVFKGQNNPSIIIDCISRLGLQPPAHNKIVIWQKSVSRLCHFTADELRCESSTSTSKELNSSILQSLSMRHR